MRWKTVITLVAIAAAIGCTIPGDGAHYDVATMALPEGDPPAGREAFVSLGCASCHGVAWDAELPQPVATVDAPQLGFEQAGYSSGLLATSIISPSHHVSTELATRSEDGLSPMADFTESMTVRQMVDIVAYLQARGGESYSRVDYRNAE